MFFRQVCSYRHEMVVADRPKRLGRGLLAGLTGFVVAFVGFGPLDQGQAASPASQPAKPPTAAAPAAVEPGMTTASFDDWMLRCQRTGTAEKPVRMCEVAETVQLQGQPGPIARVAVGRLGKNDPLHFTVLLPPNVSFPSVIRVDLGDKDASPLELAWRRCLPGTCVGEAEVRDETLKLWRAATQPGRIVFKDAGGRDIVVPLSMKGLASALDALAKEAI